MKNVKKKINLKNKILTLIKVNDLVVTEKVFQEISLFWKF